MTKYVCPRCGEQWTSKERKDPDQCIRCHEWTRPLDAKEEKK